MEKIRLDHYLRDVLGFSRSHAKKLIDSGYVKVNGGILKAGKMVLSTDDIVVDDSADEIFEIKAEPLKCEILFEDDDFLALNKPSGVITHPSEETGQYSGTIVNQTLKKVEVGAGDPLRPGIVHRLDKDTSGVLLIAKTKVAFSYLVDLFKSRSIKKTYLALVCGILEHKKGIIDSPISRSSRDRKKMDISNDHEAKEAKSLYRVLDEFSVDGADFVSLVEIDLLTGRTHQIRVHMKAIGHPVVGDNVYGKRSVNSCFEKIFGLNRQFLHAHLLEFKHLNGKKIKITAPLPMDLQNVLNKIKS